MQLDHHIKNTNEYYIAVKGYLLLLGGLRIDCELHSNANTFH